MNPNNPNFRTESESDLIQKLLEENKRLKEASKGLVEALEKYAVDWNEDHIFEPSPSLPSGGSQKNWSYLRNEDGGETARKALEQHKQKVADSEPTKPWFGKWVFMREGVEMYHEFKTKAEAEAYVMGCNDAMASTRGSDFDLSEEYQATLDQVRPVDE